MNEDSRIWRTPDEIPLNLENVIYALIDPVSGKIRYVGKAANLRRRIKRHLTITNLRGATHKVLWLNKLLALGLVPTIKILELAAEYEVLDKLEKKWIKHFRVLNYELTNGTEGGTGGKMSPEAVKKMANSKRGKTASEEHKRRISIGLTGREVSEETRAKIGAAHRGTVRTPEQRKRMSDAHIGHVHSEETKAKISKKTAGRKPTREQIDRAINTKRERGSFNTSKNFIYAMTGKKHSEETRRHMSASQKAQWAKRKAEAPIRLL